jgi:hypothetical protein
LSRSDSWNRPTEEQFCVGGAQRAIQGAKCIVGLLWRECWV